MTRKPKPAPSGWYTDPSEPGARRYWDGTDWRGQVVAQPQQQASSSRPCPYRAEPIAREALRCRHCAGELRHCSQCQTTVGTVARQKFVGLVRGGMKTQLSCLQCGKVLDGPRF